MSTEVISRKPGSQQSDSLFAIHYFMNRRQAREYALKMLFQYDFVGDQTGP